MSLELWVPTILFSAYLHLLVNLSLMMLFSSSISLPNWHVFVDFPFSWFPLVLWSSFPLSCWRIIKMVCLAILASGFTPKLSPASEPCISECFVYFVICVTQCWDIPSVVGHNPDQALTSHFNEPQIQKLKLGCLGSFLSMYMPWVCAYLYKLPSPCPHRHFVMPFSCVSLSQTSSATICYLPCLR